MKFDRHIHFLVHKLTKLVVGVLEANLTRHALSLLLPLPLLFRIPLSKFTLHQTTNQLSYRQNIYEKPVTLT